MNKHTRKKYPHAKREITVYEGTAKPAKPMSLFDQTVQRVAELERENAELKKRLSSDAEKRVAEIQKRLSAAQERISYLETMLAAQRQTGAPSKRKPVEDRVPVNTPEEDKLINAAIARFQRMRDDADTLQ